jgi:hypothetical protein
MIMSTQEVVSLLTNIPTCRDIVPVTVVLGKQSFHGAYYVQDREHDGKAYEHAAYYLAGDIPSMCRRNSRIAFDLNGEDHFIACYANEATPEAERYFQIMKWGQETPIDHHDILSGKKPYQRLSMIVIPRP